MQLTTNLDRLDAHRFYENLGFKKSHLGMKLSFGTLVCDGNERSAFK